MVGSLVPSNNCHNLSTSNLLTHNLNQWQISSVPWSAICLALFFSSTAVSSRPCSRHNVARWRIADPLDKLVVPPFSSSHQLGHVRNRNSEISSLCSIMLDHIQEHFYSISNDHTTYDQNSVNMCVSATVNACACVGEFCIIPRLIQYYHLHHKLSKAF